MKQFAKAWILSIALSAQVFLGSPARSDTGKPLLTVSGNVEPKRGPMEFDRASLEKLGLVQVETTTPWHTGRVRFEGVPMSALMRHVGAKGKSLEAYALNDYSTVIPLEDFESFNVILATRKDGQPMPVRDKGPLFIIYPYDSSPELQNQKYYSRSAWQVKELRVR